MAAAVLQVRSGDDKPLAATPGTASGRVAEKAKYSGILNLAASPVFSYAVSIRLTMA